MEEKEFLENIGIRMRKKRKELGYTQEQLAEQMGVTIQMISYAEQGKKAMRPENIVKVCDILSMSADYLLTGNDFNHKNDVTITKGQIELIKSIIDKHLLF